MPSTTIGTIKSDHFNGHKNLNEGQRERSDRILSEFIQSIKNDLEAISIVDDSVDVDKYGALGDGITDDTVAIQSALDSGKSVIRLRKKTYIITDTLNFAANHQILIGSGKDSIIRWGGAIGTIPAISIDGYDHCRISNLRVNASTTLGKAVYVEDALGTIIEKCHFDLFNVMGIQLNGASSPSTYHTVIYDTFLYGNSNNPIGIWIGTDGTETANVVLLSNVRVNNCDVGVRTEGAADVVGQLVNCNNDVTGYSHDGKRFTLIGCRCENVTTSILLDTNGDHCYIQGGAYFGPLVDTGNRRTHSIHSLIDNVQYHKWPLSLSPQQGFAPLLDDRILSTSNTFYNAYDVRTIHADPGGSNRSIIVSGVYLEGQELFILHTGVANTVTVKNSTTPTFSFELSPGQSVHIVYDGVKWNVHGITPHKDEHILGAADEIDGDQLDIDMTPSNYTPDAGVPEGGDVNHLAGHLGGIDNELGTLHARTGAPTVRGFRATGGTLSADGSEDATVLGADLIQGQTFAQVTLGASLDIIAEEPGAPGNALSVEVIDSAGVGGLAVSYAAGKLTIDLDGATPDEDTIATAVNTSGAWDGIFRANSGGGAAFGTAAEVSLTGGGTGLGCKVYVGGGLCTPAGEAGGGATSNASFSETTLVIDVPALTGLTPALAATTDDAAIWVESNGKTSNSLSKTLA